MRSKLYYVNTDRGTGIRAALTIRGAKRAAANEVGSGNVKEVRLATEKDIAWVRGMGGHVPNVGSILTVRRKAKRKKVSSPRGLRLKFYHSTITPDGTLNDVWMDQFGRIMQQDGDGEWTPTGQCGTPMH